MVFWAAALLGLFALFLFWSKGVPLRSRMTVIVWGDPVAVWSWERPTGRFSVLTLPAETVIDASYGRGTYSLDSLWRLGDIEKRGGKLLAQSLEEALAIPINGFAADLRLADFLRYTFAKTFARAGSVTTIDGSQFLKKRILADGSEELAFDSERFDRETQALFEDPRIRKEAMRVAIVNTTGSAGFAQRVGRLVGKLGALVVSVSSSERPSVECEVVGEKDALVTITAQVLVAQYSCLEKIGVGEGRADLTLYLGTALLLRP